jgi:hypothetical protein
VNIPDCRITFVRWQIECDLCGVVDSGVRHISDAKDIKRKHQQEHISNPVNPDLVDALRQSITRKPIRRKG